MKREIITTLTMALALSQGANIAVAQSSTASAPLGDVARQLKAQQAKSEAKPRVFTNDDISGLPPSSGHPAKESPNTKEAGPGQPSAKQAPGETGEEKHGQKYFRDRMGKLQDRLDIDQRELSVLQQKLGQDDMMYYPDPNKGLLQESGPTAMSDVNKAQDRIAQKKAEVAADQAAIDDLREELRRENGDAGWLRDVNLPASSPATPNAETAHNKKGNKEYWQAKFKAARAQLAEAKERQQLVEDELNLLQIKEARELDPAAKADLDEQIKAKNDRVSERQVMTQEARKALEDLQRVFRESGAPDEWSETND